MSDHTPQDPRSQLTKVCTVCKQEKPATPEYFTRNNSTRDGLHTQCKECRQRKGRERWAANADELNARRRELYPEHAEARKVYHKKWREENREQVLAKKKEYYRANSEKDLASSKAWREANPEKKKAYDREYAQKNKRRIKERQRKWEADNRDRINEQKRPKRRIYQQLRESRKSELPTDFTQDDWDRAVDFFEGKCAACGRPPGLFHSLALDHWVPLSSPDCPGTIPSNIVPLCHGVGGCNNSKHSKDPTEWLVWKFGKKKGKEVAAKVQQYFDSLKGQQ